MNDSLRMYCGRGTSVALDTYNFPEDFVNRFDIQIKGLQYLLSHWRLIPYNNVPTKEQLITRAVNMFERSVRENNVEAIREIGDIIQMHGTPEQNRQIIDRMRELDIEIEAREVKEQIPHRNYDPIPEIKNNRPIIRDNVKPLFNDSQSVHNNDINTSVLNAASWLVSNTEEINIPRRLGETEDDYIRRVLEYKDNICKGISNTLVKLEPHREAIIRTACEYIRTSVGGFGRNITLFDTFLAVWLWIEKQTKEYQEELMKRLCEEMQGMKGMCSTGHLARLINVLQGFTDNPNLAIRISDREQCKNVVVSYLTRCLQNSTDEKVQDGMLDHNEEYIKFLRLKVAERILEWKKDYEGILVYLPDIVNNFAGIKVFTE